ncbi:cupin domain-containing protein [Maribacter algarum]|uniref:Cupin domain-containing protein n=1 Tax=Maribacter algarum (ex Zhang et al. 2020) TaxID=2578118 RepID=A0A5S3QMU5_9FLAO|nr:cupin domain-containing protein [Maribacter algarum]TMM59224.1 cupin domain-containing protein [Maribacter algarum]
MKNLPILFILLASLSINAQSSEYQVSSYLSDGVKAPNTHHIGEAWLNFLVEANADFDKNITQATFSANSTLDWHKHATAQVIIVVDGEGYYQERGKNPVVIKKGDVITCFKETEHWHTSSADSAVSYIAIYGKEPTVWTEKLTQEYYHSVAEELKGK